MFSDYNSCSDCNSISCPDCKQELYEKRWTKVLLDWINLCVLPGGSVQELHTKIPLEILSRYKDDICDDLLDQEEARPSQPVWLRTDRTETLLQPAVPTTQLYVSRLHYSTKAEEIVENLSDITEMPRKLYIMASVLLYHCCVSSQTGAVDLDICRSLDVLEQELILKFCENLGQMEVTINNVDAAVAGAFEATPGVDFGKLDYKPPETKPFTACVPKCDRYEPVTKESSSLEAKPSQESTSNAIPASNEKTTTFKSSVTVMPSVVSEICGDMSDLTDSTDSVSSLDERTYAVDSPINVLNYEEQGDEKIDEKTEQANIVEKVEGIEKQECITCCRNDMAAGDMFEPHIPREMINRRWIDKGSIILFAWKRWLLFVVVLLVIGGLALLFIIPGKTAKPTVQHRMVIRRERGDDEIRTFFTPNMQWECKHNLCQKLYKPATSGVYYKSLSRCTLLCTGPQLWPYPIGSTYFSKTIVAIAKNKLEYKFQTIPSTIVREYLAEAFKLFLGDLARLERIDLEIKNKTQDLVVKKLYIQIDVESDPDPRLRIDTEESYDLKVDMLADQIKVTISSPSFCGVRHGLETLGQLILLDQSSGFLITLSKVEIKDGPCYKYRGLMIDTARNYIPVPDLMRTIDAMASCKLNTFHWRISDVTSFPLLVPDYPQLFEYGAYDRSLVYTVDDIKTLVNRARVRGIRVLIEVAAPGPVGRAFSWASDVTCPSTNASYTCENALCLRLKMTETIFNILENIYSLILDLTKVDDIFHLSDGLFSFTQCYYLLDDREAFLDKALARLKIANKGFLPKLPVIWYTAHLSRKLEASAWEKFGVQINEWQSNPSDLYLSKYKAIHSSKWDLSCELRKQRCRKYRTWQEMYAWKSWRNLEVMTIEGGEAVLWTDLVDRSNLDTHLWPRVAAVAERLWSDIVANHTPSRHEYLRLDAQRWRMLFRSVRVQPVWPVWCSFNPIECLKKISL